MKDWEDHITVAFPEVRLKQYLEMRGADGGPWNIICALPALWVGLLYDDESQAEAYDLAKSLMSKDVLEEGRVSASKLALGGKIGEISIEHLANEMLRISSSGLERRNVLDHKGMNERQFLDPLFRILQNKETGAEKLIKKYNTTWNKNVNKIFTENSY